MAHVYNDPTEFRDDATAGFVSAYGRYVEMVPEASAVMRRGGPRAGKVSVIIGGGSGHYPAFCGLVGQGLADGAVIGDIFTSPSTEQAYRTGRALDGGAGLLFSFGNYAGDVMNFGLAQERLRADGIDCRTVLVTDDVASAPIAEMAKRRGVAGDFSVFKIAGAAADRGDDLDTVEALARRTNAATVSFGVAFDGCTFPGRDEPLFHVQDGHMDIGLGIHGEPGIRTVPWMPARELAAVLVEPLLAERPAAGSATSAGAKRRRAAVILNGLGATKYEELFVLWHSVARLLDEAGVEPVLPEVGELVTSLDMAGCSLTLTWLDDELEELWAAPADTPAFRRGAVHAPTHSAVVPTAARSTGAEAAAPASSQPAPASSESREVATTVRAVLHAMLDTVVQHEEELGRIDAVAGDGDHGVGMVRGLRAAVDAADAAADAGAGGTLTTAGLALADKAGGSSGVLWGAILTAAGTALGDQQTPGADGVAAGVRAGTDALQRLGQCEIGDKTMYDALRPFSDVLTEKVGAGGDLAAAWREAAGVATERATATAELTPRLGRARPLAERSIGTPDAGATSMALLLTAITDVLTGTPCAQGDSR